MLLANEDDTNVVRVLKKAKELVSKGWTQDIMYERKGNQHCYCATGAISSATNKLGLSHVFVAQKCRDLLAQAIPKGHTRTIIAYNDSRRRTQQQVIRWFERAIKLAEERT